MKTYIYLEGGASGPHSKNLTIRCQQAFHALLARMGFTGKMPRLKPCGGRDSVYDDFCTAHKAGNLKYVAMWIDSEEPLDDIEHAWKHLAEVTTVNSWKKPDGAVDDQVLFMTTCMETWIAADREALREHYGQNLNEKSLPSMNNLESRQRHDVQQALVTATKNCDSGYAKGKPSFDILEKLDPAVLAKHLPSFVRVARILKAQL